MIPISSLRTVVVGARCSHQGIGEHVARFLAQAGAAVEAVVGTHIETASEAARNLQQRHGLRCRPYDSLEHALAEQQPDLVALCSPYRYHLDQLARVAESGAHCLCEKPLWWTDRDDPNDRPPVRPTTSRIAEEFSRRGRLLTLVTQWPCTLAAFDELHPSARKSPVESFTMFLGPHSTGLKMVIDAAPHPISMLQALLGPGRMEEVEASWQRPALDMVILRGRYVHHSGLCAFGLTFRCTPSRPRLAAYSINGARACRRIDLGELRMGSSDLRTYRMRLGDGPDPGARFVDLPDPLERLARDTVESAREASTSSAVSLRARSELLVQGLECLEVLEQAAVRALSAANPEFEPLTELL